MRFENPLLLLILGLVFVISMILPSLRQWLERRARAVSDEAAGTPEVQTEARALVPAWRRGEQRRQAAAVSHDHGTRPRRRGLRLGSRRDLRHAIVLMTILGPCRALERDDGRR
jgi:hypothetical protein